MLAPKCTSEEARLDALRRYGILDTPLERSYDEIVALVARVCDVPVSLISLVDRDRQWFKARVGLDMRETPMESSICAHAILQPGILEVPDTLEDERFSDNPLVSGDPHLRFYAGAPLQTEDGHALGTLCVLDYKPRVLTDEQRAILEVLAHQVMIQMEMHRAIQDRDAIAVQLRAAMSELEASHLRDRNIASQLEEAIKPSWSGNAPGLDIFEYYQAALDESSVGGDFYDVVALGGSRHAIVIGDVSGKGLTAASQVSAIRNMLRYALLREGTLSEAVETLNQVVIQQQTLNGFVTLFAAIFDAEDRTLQYVSCGHEPAILRRTSGETQEIMSCGPPVGVKNGAAYPAGEVTLERGDTLFLYTDGLSEAGPSRSQLIGTSGIVEFLDKAPSESLEALVKYVVGAIEEYAVIGFRDDVGILAVRAT